MAKQNRSVENELQEITSVLKRRMQEASVILLLAASGLLCVALSTYHSTDPGWSRAVKTTVIHNGAGRLGAWGADLFFYWFGYIAYIFPVMLAYSSSRLFYKGFAAGPFHRLLWGLRVAGFFLALVAGCGLGNLHFLDWETVLPNQVGGVVGRFVSHQMVVALGEVGASLVLLASFLTGMTLATGLSWFGLMDKLGKAFFSSLFLLPIRLFRKMREKKNTEEAACVPVLSNIPNKLSATAKKSTALELTDQASTFKISPGSGKKSLLAEHLTEHKGEMGALTLRKPSLSLLEKEVIQESAVKVSEESLQALSREVEARLLEFGVQGRVGAVCPGPVITQLELELAAGVKVNKVTSLSKDLARALMVSRVRVVEVIPGKPVVGLEIPNKNRAVVRLRAILEAQAYTEAESPLTLALGKDIHGNASVVDLGKMPHLLVAGTTGSGKSVGINAMLLSMLYKASPEEIRLILIDPKMLELAIYEGIPHLLTPVVTDMKDAANALRWCVGEMERRYQLMAKVGVRNLAGFNTRIQESEKSGEPILDPLWQPAKGGEPSPLKTLPYIVVIIDEFADMMMVVGKKVEELIARIAQKARAAGIHMILATQRPSVDVITGLIKANVPARIAFQVSSRIDSRTILDQQGAEQLLGYGDMLYLAPGMGIPTRIHGAFVSDEEVHRVVRALKLLGEPDFAEDILKGSSAAMGGGSASFGGLDEMGDLGEDGESDPLYDEAVQIVMETRKTSISHLQRQLRIGYNRAARLIETMQEAGLLSPTQANGGREILVNASQV